MTSYSHISRQTVSWEETLILHARLGAVLARREIGKRSQLDHLAAFMMAYAERGGGVSHEL